ncbi:MAG TPA: NEW3 domain-containing protein [Acidobacteriota bacterium]|nr:NEW3 domain-containing protein [Acidobacteriota bacterium]
MAALLLGGLTPLRAQLGNPFNERDDKYRLLGLKRAKAYYEQAQSDFERTKELYDQRLITRAELDKARSTLSDAEVNYYQSLLAVVFEGQYVAIIEAVQYQAEDGKKHVRLKVENTSGGGDEYRRLLNIDDELFRAMQPDVIHDVYISLLDDDNAIISNPYEAKIEELHYGEPAEVDFTLLRDVDAVTVGISYGNGSQRSPKISLQKDSSVNKVILQSSQFSQEAELGASATFNLTLELFSGENDTFKLAVVNLPAQLNRYFVDPSTQARLTQFRFTEGANTRQAALEVSLPDRPGEEIEIDKPIPFYVMVIPREQAQALGNLNQRSGRTSGTNGDGSLGDSRLAQRLWTEEEIAALNVGYLRLELVPRGVGELLVRVPQLYFAAKPGEQVEIPIELTNEGTQRLDNIELKVDPPLNWTKSVEPPLLASLDVGEEARVSVFVTPPAQMTVGKYEVRVQSTSLSDNQPVDGEDKTITVELQTETDVTGIAVVVGAIVALVLGIVIFGIRLSRR